MIFNGDEEPMAVMKLSTDNFRMISAGENNPINMFMSGDIKLEGDMGFAMSLQPVFF